MLRQVEFGPMLRPSPMAQFGEACSFGHLRHEQSDHGHYPFGYRGDAFHLTVSELLRGRVAGPTWIWFSFLREDVLLLCQSLLHLLFYSTCCFCCFCCSCGFRFSPFSACWLWSLSLSLVPGLLEPRSTGPWFPWSPGLLKNPLP